MWQRGSADTVEAQQVIDQTNDPREGRGLVKMYGNRASGFSPPDTAGAGITLRPQGVQ